MPTENCEQENGAIGLKYNRSKYIHVEVGLGLHGQERQNVSPIWMECLIDLYLTPAVTTGIACFC